MGIAMSFILGLFLRIFQFFCFILKNINKSSKLTDKLSVFCHFFYFFTKKTAQSLMDCGFARLFSVCPRSITSGLLGTEFPKSIKNYSQFSVFGGSHD